MNIYDQYLAVLQMFFHPRATRSVSEERQVQRAQEREEKRLEHAA
jgi:hypothetical protein